MNHVAKDLVAAQVRGQEMGQISDRAASEGAPPDLTGPAKVVDAVPAGSGHTCARCGREMRYNVPRMGPAGGFVHKHSCNLLCDDLHARSIDAWSAPLGGPNGASQTAAPNTQP